MYKFEHNMGYVEQVFRLIVGLVAVIIAVLIWPKLVELNSWNIVIFLVMLLGGILFTFSGFTGHSFLYQAFKISTHPRHKPERQDFYHEGLEEVVKDHYEKRGLKVPVAKVAKKASKRKNRKAK